jgi:predicted unusual protein kinase regulating ubiquinone biosynthesis (AarF/ABC1/UbiB family)
MPPEGQPVDDDVPNESTSSSSSKQNHTNDGGIISPTLTYSMNSFEDDSEVVEAVVMDDAVVDAASSASWQLHPPASKDDDEYALGQKRESSTPKTRPVFQRRPGSAIRLLVLISLFSLTGFFYYTNQSNKNHHGNYLLRVQRTFQFWSRMAPIVMEYKLIQFQKQQPRQKQQRRLEEFHAATAPKILSIILDMRGIFVKLGQIVSTVGVGLVPDAYVETLKVLQDGVPPKSYEEIARIIESTTGQRMEELFASFDETPLGAASIAQAHYAVLKKNTDDEEDDTKNPPTPCVVKVQYQEVAELFEIDFWNVRAVTQMLNPENLDLLDSLRERHVQELDFRIEAEHLDTIRNNLQRHQVEPQLVRMPKVLNETGICSERILVLEYLSGVSLQRVMEREHAWLAEALGTPVSRLRNAIVALLRHSSKSDGDYHDEDANHHHQQQEDAETRMARRALQAPPILARILRFQGRWKLWWKKNILSKIDRRQQRLLPPTQSEDSKRIPTNVDLTQVLKTLIRVQGIQMLRDGIFNVDPHPGNVLILPDGRSLGLLDYGMVGRISDEERLKLARLVLAMQSRNKHQVARLYRESGYRGSWKEGEFTDPILYRLAKLHLDRFDLSPVFVDDVFSGETTVTNTTQHNNKNQNKKHRRSVDMLDIIHTAQEKRLPPWFEKSRRMAALLLGITAQAARPISLAHEWQNLARETIRELEKKQN